MMNKIKNILLFLTFISLSAVAQNKEKGIKFYDYHKYQSAITELTPLSETDKMANYYLGLSYLGLEQLDKAKATFQKNADNAANLSGLARVLFAEDKPDEAMAILEKVINLSTKKNKSPYFYAADAITYSYGGNYNKAIEWYAVYKEKEGETPELLIHEGDAYRRIQGGGGNAMSDFQNAAERGGDLSISNYKQGNLWYAAQNYDSALACYSRASETDPNNPLPFYDLANAYYKINKYDRARTQIEKYLTLSDNSPEDQMQYANILYLSKDYDGAINKMNELLSSGNGKSYMHRVLGYSYLEKKNLTEALKNMDLLFQKHPVKKLIPDDYFTYGKILAATEGRKGEANAYFEKGIQADTTTDKVPLYRQLAESFKDADDYANAAIWYKKVTEQNSTKKEALDYWWAGRCYYQVSDYVNANDMYTKMTIERPDEPSGFYWLAKVAAAQDPEYSTGLASEKFIKWLGMVKDDPAKKDEMVNAYTYLSVVAYNKKNYTDAKNYADKIVSLEPANSTAKQILTNIPK